MSIHAKFILSLSAPSQHLITLSHNPCPERLSRDALFFHPLRKLGCAFRAFGDLHLTLLLLLLGLGVWGESEGDAEMSHTYTNTGLPPTKFLDSRSILE